MTLYDKTLARLLDVATSQLGYTEQPAKSNRTKYGEAIGLNGQPWCLSFVWWCFDRAGFALYRTGSCSALVERYRKYAPAQIVTSGFRRGDIVFFDWSGDRRITEHVGIVTAAQPGSVRTIEGNTSVGNDSNGGAVMERTRAIGLITCAIRPKYPDAVS